MSRIVIKPTKWHVDPAKTHISLGSRPVWSESSLSACIKLWSLATHWVHSDDSDQTGLMPRLIWVFAGRTVILLVLSRGGSNMSWFQAYEFGCIFERHGIRWCLRDVIDTGAICACSLASVPVCLKLRHISCQFLLKYFICLPSI